MQSYRLTLWAENDVEGIVTLTLMGAAGAAAAASEKPVAEITWSLNLNMKQLTWWSTLAVLAIGQRHRETLNRKYFSLHGSAFIWFSMFDVCGQLATKDND